MPHALITGGSQGIGYHIADELARRSYDVTLVARHEQGLRDATTALERRHSVEASWIAMDLSSTDSADDLIEEAGDVDILVNNAGFGDADAFQDTGVATHQSMLILNCYTPMTLAHHYIDDGADVINVASTAAYQPLPGMASYAATKAHVYSWSTALNQEVSQTVHTLCPGPTRTGFVDRAGMSDDAFSHGHTPRRVAQEGIAAFENGDAVHIVGWQNKALVALSRLLPPSWMATLIGHAQS